MTIMLIITLIIYLTMIFSIRYRTAIATIGIGILLLYSTIFLNYSFSDAFTSFPFEIIVLVITLALYTKVFEINGFLTNIGNKINDLSKQKKLFIIIVVPFIMYITSLFMNNLSVVLLFTFICLTFVKKLNFPVVPILVSGLISSNIGGCPLPWADTPAVIITLYSNFTLIDFLSNLFIPCFIFEILLLIYTYFWYKFSNKDTCKDKKSDCKKSIFYHKPNKLPPPPPNGEEPPPPYEPPPHLKVQVSDSKIKRLYLPVILFFLFIFSICIAPFFNISISYFCIFFLGAALLLLVRNPEEILNSLSVLDSLIFISSLFMISGMLEHFGILNTAVNYIVSFTSDNKLLILLCILICAFIISTFLSAGPATATLIPVCIQLSPIIGNNFIYVALALGILAGSSMLPWSATGGPIMLSEVDRYLHHNKLTINEKNRIKEIYNFKKHVSFSIPFSLIILGFSALYLFLYTIL